MDKVIHLEIEKYEPLLALNSSISMPEAEKRSARFLLVMAHITNWRHMLNEEKIKLVSVQTAVFHQELSKGTGKTMTENKMAAEASLAYIAAREDLERIDNDLSYLKAYYEIFQNAHVFFRQMAKGEGV